MHRLFEVDGVEDFDAVAFLQKGVAHLQNRGAFRVGENIGAVHLQEIGLDPKSRLAAAGAAYNQDIFVPGRLGVFGPAGHGETFGLGQDDVVLKLGSHIRLDVFGIAPAGRAVLAAVAVLLGVLAFQVDRQIGRASCRERV